MSLNTTQAAVECYHYAVSDSSRAVRYFRAPDSSHPMLSLHRAQQSPEQIQVEVQSITLDDFFSGREPKPDLVKMEVEGAELDVLHGMTTLLPHISRIDLEVHPAILAAAGQSFAELYELLSQHFALYLIPDHRSQQPAEPRRIQPGETLPSNTIILARRLGE